MIIVILFLIALVFYLAWIVAVKTESIEYVDNEGTAYHYLAEGILELDGEHTIKVVYYNYSHSEVVYSMDANTFYKKCKLNTDRKDGYKRTN